MNDGQTRIDSSLKELIERSANAGNTSAMMRLSDLSGWLFGPSLGAIEWLERAASNGNSSAILKLGALASRGNYTYGTSMDWLKNLEKSVEFSESDKYEFLIAEIFFSGLGGVKKNFVLSLPWFQAASKSVRDANVRLAMIHLGGGVLDTDFDSVLKYVSQVEGDNNRQELLVALYAEYLNSRPVSPNTNMSSESEIRFVRESQAALADNNWFLSDEDDDGKLDTIRLSADISYAEIRDILTVNVDGLSHFGFNPNKM